MADASDTKLTSLSCTDLTSVERSAAARTTNNLFQRWEINDIQSRRILGGMSAHRWLRWKAGDFGEIEQDIATRLMLLLGLHVSLRTIFGADTARAYGWVKAPNSAFAGASALDIMQQQSIKSLEDLHRYLGAQCHGG